VAVVDGVEGPEFDEYGFDIVFSPDSQRVAYVAKRGEKDVAVLDGDESAEHEFVGSYVFSPDSKRVAYEVQDGEKCHAVIDGIGGKEYDSSNLAEEGEEAMWMSSIHGVTFSADSEHVAYCAMSGDKWVVVADGVESKEYDGIVQQSVIFDSPATFHLIAIRDGEGFFVEMEIAEGETPPQEPPAEEENPLQEEQPAEENPATKPAEPTPGSVEGLVEASLTVSPDWKRVAYVVQRDEKQLAVVDGVAGAEYDKIIGPVFSSDSQRVAYVARRGEKWVAVVDGKKGAEYDFIADLHFSSDSKNVIYVGMRGGKYVPVVDGVEGKEYDCGVANSVSPDGKRHAIIAKRGDKWLIIIDGVEGREYDVVGTTVFSPDGNRVAYMAKEGEKQFIVVDGAEGKEYEGVGPIAFSPDSKHIAYAAKQGEKWVVVVDGVEGKEYDAFLKWGGFDSANKLHALAVIGGKISPIEIETAQSGADEKDPWDE